MQMIMSGNHDDVLSIFGNHDDVYYLYSLCVNSPLCGNILLMNKWECSHVLHQNSAHNTYNLMWS